MTGRAATFRAIAAILCLVSGAATARESVGFPSFDRSLNGGTATELRATYERPPGPGPHPAAVLMHGCSGGFGADGRPGANFRAWARLLVDRGYAVLIVDSFRPRGEAEVCTRASRPIMAGRERPYDAFGAHAWLAARPEIDADRIALIGWSHGAHATLRAIDANTPHRPIARRQGYSGDFRLAIAFYPGCGVISRERWTPVAPTLLLLAENDDWTPAAPCAALSEAAQARGQPVEHVLYPNAYHAFDVPNLRLRLRTDINAPGGRRAAHVGTEPAARADAMARVPDFLDRHLKAAPAAR